MPVAFENDNKTLLVGHYGEEQMKGLYTFDVDQEKMAEMKPIAYKSRDGLTIHGYLTLPKDSTGKNLPLVVNPHGGPVARDTWGYDPSVQFLANRGYAVLRMNFRGSTGDGKDFM